MDLGLTGKKALILASSQGLGFAVATKLCLEGADVVIMDSLVSRFIKKGKIYRKAH